jgi:hypothetical protein
MRSTSLAVGLILAWAAAPTAWARSEALWNATARIESGGDEAARNRREDAVGIVQIRRACLDDANRIARLRGLDLQFRPRDRYDVEKSRQIWELYLSYYGEEYERATGAPPTEEVYARIWNGGPVGWRKRRTLSYWRRIIQAMRETAEPVG